MVFRSYPSTGKDGRRDEGPGSVAFYNSRGIRLSIDVEEGETSRVLGEAINRRSLFEAMEWAESDKTGDAHDDATVR
jgi:hypothetical protein